MGSFSKTYECSCCGGAYSAGYWPPQRRPGLGPCAGCIEGRKKAGEVVGSFWPDLLKETPGDDRSVSFYLDSSGWQVSFFGVDGAGDRREVVYEVLDHGIVPVS